MKPKEIVINISKNTIIITLYGSLEVPILLNTKGIKINSIVINKAR